MLACFYSPSFAEGAILGLRRLLGTVAVELRAVRAAIAATVALLATISTVALLAISIVASAV